MKVLQVLNHFLPYQTAGTEVYTWALSKHLQQNGITVKVVIPHYGQTKDNDYVYDELPVYQYAEPSVVNRSLIMGFHVPEGLKNFIKYLKNEKPDLVHFHDIAGSNGISLHHVTAAKSLGAKVIITLHLVKYSCKTATLVHNGLNKCNGIVDLKKCSNCYLQSKGYKYIAPYLTLVSNFLLKSSINPKILQNPIGSALGTVSIISELVENLHLLIKNCDRVVCITNWYKQILLDNGVEAKKICYIPQGLPLDVTSAPLHSKIVNKPLRLLFLGRINKFKGLHLLIEALSTIDPDLFELSIYGNSDDLDYESSLTLKTEQFNNILWKGKLPQHEVVNTMQEYDILCLCSTISEMSPLVIQEAFAAGIPVLASNVYGNAEQIQHNYNGLLFDYNNVDDLKLQILRCVNEEDLLMNLTKNITFPKSFRDVGNQYLDLYKSLLN